MPFRFDNFNHLPKVIPDATPLAAGVMSSADKAKLDGIPPGGAGTLASAYAAGTVAADQTPLIEAAKGGPVNFKGKIPGVGSLLRALDSAGNVLLDISDSSAQILRSAFADGPARVMFVFDTLFSILDPTAFLFETRNAGASKWRVTSEGAAEFFGSIAATAGAGRQRFNSTKMQVCNDGVTWEDILTVAPGFSGLAVTGGGGAVVVPNANVAAGSKFNLTIQDGGAAPTNGVYVSARTPGVDFTISSISGDVGVQVYYQIFQ